MTARIQITKRIASDHFNGIRPFFAGVVVSTSIQSPKLVVSAFPFAYAAKELRRHGLAVLPLGGDDGKVSQVKYKGIRRPPTRLDGWIKSFPDCNVGVLLDRCEPHGYTVIDIDARALVDECIDRFGDTPLKITGRRGVHLWYQSNGEPNIPQARMGMAVDVKGAGGVVVVPPSYHRGTGTPYTFLEGSWDDLDRLPKIRPGALPATKENVAIAAESRGNVLFRTLLKRAPTVDSKEALAEVAETLNAAFPTPMRPKDVIRTAKRVWTYHAAGRNYFATGGALHLPHLHMKAIHAHPDSAIALRLLTELMCSHHNRSTFAIAPDAMEAADVIPGWSKHYYRKARDVLVDLGILECIERPRARHAGRYALVKPAKNADFG